MLKAKHTPLLILAVAILSLPTTFAMAQADKNIAAYSWLPAEAAADGAAEASTVPREVLPVTFTKLPKPTADLAKYTRIYRLELDKFGIKNDGTAADATSAGLNAALQHAKTLNVNRIVFPAGTYLIHEKTPVVLDHKDTVIDLGGATLQMNTNGLPKYAMVTIVTGAENMRLTNGTLRGDRDTHDYKTIQATHEHCSLLSFFGGKNLEVDNLTVTNAPGFAITTRPQGSRTRPELLAMIHHSVNIRDLEQGALSDKGQPAAATDKTRTVKFYDISRAGGEFEFGYTPGYMGFPYIKDRNYQVFFYDADQKFLAKQHVLQFRKVQVPTTAKFLKLEFNQPEVSMEPGHSGAGREGFCGRITNLKPPTDVHFHHNKVTNNRALGLAFCGGQKWILEDSIFEGNGGQAPSYAIDFEDGWELMQDVVVRNNVFRKNHNDLVVCAGSELLFEGNQFEKTVFFYGRTYNYTIRGNTFMGGKVGFNTRSGILKILDNIYRNCLSVSTSFDGKGVADGFLREPGKEVSTPAITLINEKFENVALVTGTYMKMLGGTLQGTRLVAGKNTVLVDLQNTKVKDSVLFYEATGPTVWQQVLTTGDALKIEGPGLIRKRDLPKR